MSTRLRAPSASVEPQAAKKALPPPKVPVPRLRAGTMKPEAPSRRCSMGISLRVGSGAFFATRGAGDTPDPDIEFTGRRTGACQRDPCKVQCRRLAISMSEHGVFRPPGLA